MRQSTALSAVKSIVKSIVITVELWTLMLLSSCTTTSSPSIQDRLAAHLVSDNKKIEVHGHRGARTRYPENSMPAFIYALKLGVDVLEMDCQRTKDGFVIVAHDPAPNPSHCKTTQSQNFPTGRFDEMTLAEVQALDCGSLPHPDFPNQILRPGTKIPMLDDVLRLVSLSRNQTVKMNIEVKTTPELHNDDQVKAQVNAVLAVIRRHGLMNRVIIQSFDQRALTQARALDPEIAISYLSKGFFARWVSNAVDLKAQFTSPAAALVDASGVTSAHEAGIKVLPWTVNDSKGWSKLIEAGVDGIITDDPEALLKFLGRADGQHDLNYK